MTTTAASYVDGYVLGKTLGVGFSAKVKHATGQDGSHYAIKLIDLAAVSRL